jgi:hypothetical protein
MLPADKTANASFTPYRSVSCQSEKADISSKQYIETKAPLYKSKTVLFFLVLHSTDTLPKRF